jgi:hypothetical protein
MNMMVQAEFYLVSWMTICFLVQVLPSGWD